MGRDDHRAERPIGDVKPQDPLSIASEADTSDDYVQHMSEMSAEVRAWSLAKAARAASRRRGEFRWYEFRARRRFRTRG